MTQEKKELLLKDLCARLPYGVMFDYNNNEPLKVEGIVRDMVYFSGYNYRTGGSECYADITRCKPYLRPMSSMTEEENKELFGIVDNYGSDSNAFDGYELGDDVDWLNANHFDYRGLIEKSLALEAPKDMYNN